MVVAIVAKLKRVPSGRPWFTRSNVWLVALNAPDLLLDMFAAVTSEPEMMSDVSMMLIVFEAEFALAARAMAR